MNSKRPLVTPQVAKILVVDDHPLIRQGLAELIADQPGLEVCGEATNVQQGLEQVQATQPDLVIVDISLVDSNGLDLTKEIKASFPQVKILVMTAYDESLYAERALRAGAMGYINKRELQENLMEAIQTVLAGKRYMSQRMAQRLIEMSLGSKAVGEEDPCTRLTDRELEIFKLIGSGKTSGEIADQLILSTHTIDSHRENIKRKLGLKNVGELTRAAVQWVLENG